MAPHGLLDLLHRNAQRYGTRRAVNAFGEGRWSSVSWPELAAMAGSATVRAAKALAGERIALVAMDNSVGSLAAFLGLAAAGLDLAVFEADSAQLRDPESVFRATGASSMIVPAAAAPSGTGAFRVLRTSELTRQAAPAMSGRSGVGMLAMTVLQATSGSTGEPRLARQPLANLLRGGAIYQGMYGLTADDEILAAVPYAHSFGMVAGLFAAIVSGASLTTFTGFSPRGMREAVAGGATVVLGTPLVYELVNRTRGSSRSAVRLALSSGGPLAPAVGAAAQDRLGVRIFQVYGSTETGVIACQRPRAEPWPVGCVGLPAPGVQLRLTAPPCGQLDDDPEDAGSELRVRTATMFDGYLGGLPVPYDEWGYYRTGDMAAVGRDGCLHLMRRKESFINVGGRKVNAARVQRLMSDFPAVVDAVVYGVETVGGEEVRAAVVLVGDGGTGPLLAHCRSLMDSYEVPHQIHVLPRLPRNGMGKVDRSQLPC